MKKFLSIVALCFLFMNTAYAANLEDRIAKAENQYEQRIQKIDASRYKTERKEILKKHAKQNFDLKVQQLKDLDNLKNIKSAKKVAKKSTKRAKKA